MVLVYLNKSNKMDKLPYRIYTPNFNLIKTEILSLKSRIY